MDSYEPETPVRILAWGIRRADGFVTASTEAWAREVHDMVGLPIVRFDPVTGTWADVP